MSSLPLLRTAAIRESVADLLRAALLDGRFQPGQSLSEPALAAELGVSRGPVREALLVLSQEGLLVHQQNRGYTVITLDAEDRAAMFLVRLPLETLALELARPHTTPADLATLESHLARLLAAYPHDPRECARADREFHELIWDRSRNLWLQAALRRIMTPFFTFSMLAPAVSPTLTPALLEQQHRAYLAYLDGSSPDSAETCVRLHLSLYQ